MIWITWFTTSVRAYGISKIKPYLNLAYYKKKKNRIFTFWLTTANLVFLVSVDLYYCFLIKKVCAKFLFSYFLCIFSITFELHQMTRLFKNSFLICTNTHIYTHTNTYIYIFGVQCSVMFNLCCSVYTVIYLRNNRFYFMNYSILHEKQHKEIPLVKFGLVFQRVDCKVLFYIQADNLWVFQINWIQIDLTYYHNQNIC